MLMSPNLPDCYLAAMPLRSVPMSWVHSLFFSVMPDNGLNHSHESPKENATSSPCFLQGLLPRVGTTCAVGAVAYVSVF